MFEIDPLSAIASGALLLSAAPGDESTICQALEIEGIPCAEIGRVEGGKPQVWRRTTSGIEQLPRPTRDEIARVFDSG